VSDIAEELRSGQFGPVFQGGRFRARGAIDWRRLALTLTAVLGVLAFGTVSTVGVLVYLGVQKVDRISIAGLGEVGDQVRIPNGEERNASRGAGIDEVTDVRNVLLVGTDSREGLTDEQLLRLGTEDEGTNLTDTIMLFQLDPKADHATVLSFPRDLLVTYCDGSKGRINKAYQTGQDTSFGGPGCLVRTIQDLTTIPIDHYVEVDFAGFIDAVDAVGGVTFYVDEPLTDRYAGLDVDPGCVTFDGAKALGFVRARHLGDDDFGRIARQQRFLRELVSESTSLDTLTNPARIVSLVNAVAGSITTDDQLSTGDMVELAYSFRELSNAGLDTRTVPGQPGMWGDAAVVFLDDAESARLFSDFRLGLLGGQPAGQPAAPPVSEPAPLTPAEVPALLVLNGAGVKGLASVGSEALTARGFAVSRTDNAPDFGLGRTEVLYAPDRRGEAELVAAAIPGAALVPAAASSPLTVVLGEDFDPARMPPPPPPPVATPAVATPDADVAAEGAGSSEPAPEPTYAGATVSAVSC